MNSPFEFATKYSKALGWSIVPINPSTKRPPISWERYQSHYPRKHELEKWFKGRTWEQVGVGLITGRISDIIVIDIDDTSGNLYDYDSPVKVRSGGGGTHLYYKWSQQVHNKVRINGSPVDLRGDGGLIVLPPTIHPSGNRYKWINDGKLTDLVKNLPKLPDFIFALKDEKKAPMELTEIVGAGEGSRNDKLYKVACSLAKKPPKDVMLTVSEINKTFDPPLEDGEVVTIVKSALRHNKWSDEKLDQEIPDPIPAPRSMASLAKELREMKEYENSAASTGYPELDNIIKGFLPGHLYTFTGETNAGKSTVAVNFCFNVAKQGKKCLYIALEPDIQIAVFFQALNLNKRFDQLKEEDFEKDVNNVDILLHRDCESLDKLKQIVSQVGQRYDLIVIDHIGYFIPDSDNYIQKQAAILKQLALYSKENKNSVFIIAHPRKLNRTKRITMDDIAGSAAFKQDSTEVLILHREFIEEDGIDGQMSTYARIQVAKKKVSMPSKKAIAEITFVPGKPQVISYKKTVETPPDITEPDNDDLYDSRLI